MHILLLAPGISVHSQRFLQMLLEKGHSVTFLDSVDPVPKKAARYKFIRYPNVSKLKTSRIRGAFRLGHMLELAILRRILRRVKPDVVHVHWVDSRAYYCAKAGLHPLILSCWGSDINNLFEEEKSDASYEKQIGWAVSQADAVTADSPEVLERCEKLAGKRLNKHQFYFGIDLKMFRPGYDTEASQLKRELGIGENVKVILSPRALRPFMGHHFVLEAFSLLRADPKFSNTALVFTRYLPFADGYEQELRNRVIELQLERQVYWLDAAPNHEMPIHYAFTDVVVNYPERDGFPVTLFEAASCMRPVVSSFLPAYKEVFGDDSIEYVPSKNPVLLAKAIASSLIEEKGRSYSRLHNASEVVERVGDQTKCLAVMESVYRSVCGTE